MQPIKVYIQHLINATKYSWQGLKAAWQNEKAFQIEGYLSIIILPLAICLGDNAIERALLILTWAMVPMCELINSAIEAAIDRIGPEQHPLSGRAKDLGSAAVMIAALICATVWFLILFTK